MKRNAKAVFFSLVILFIGNIGIISCDDNPKKPLSSLEEFSRFYKSIADSISKNSDYVCMETQKKMAATHDSAMYYHYAIVLAKTYMFKSEMDSVKLYLNQAEHFCAQSSSAPGCADLYSEIYNMRGNLAARQGNVHEAVTYFTKALNFRLKGQNAEGLSDISLNLADAYVRSGRFDKGALWYRKALFFCDSLNIPADKYFPAYYGLAQVYMELRDFEQCDYYYDMAAQWYESMLPYEKCIYLNNRGNSYYFRKDYPRALEMFKAELALAKRFPDMVFEEHLSEMNLGETFLLMNQTDSAAYYLNECQDFFRSIGNRSALYYLDTQLIELALKQNNLPLAQKRLNNAIKLDYVEPNMLHIRNRYLQHYFAESGDYKKAYYYQSENQRIDDSIRNERIKMRTAEIDLKYKQDTTLMKQKIFIQQKENEVLELNQQIYVWMFSCIGIFILVIFVYLYNKKQKNLLQMKSQYLISTLRMENIRNRISPHFIFNILNREMSNYTEEQTHNMQRLVKLLRRNLELTSQLCVTIAEELDFVHTYIDLERKALGEHFTLSLHIDESIDAEKEVLPAMMMQIPIENAIKHALLNKEGERKLWIDIRREQDAICIRIKDNGGGYKISSKHRGTGTGMKVILQTVQLLNAQNKYQIGIAVNNVSLGESEQGCEFVITLPVGYNYNFKKIV